SVLRIEGSKPLVIRGPDENHASGRCNRSTHVDPAGVFLSFRQFIGDSQRDLPNDITGIRIDGRELSPCRPLTWPTLLTQKLALSVDFTIPEFRGDGIAPHACTIVGNTRSVGLFLDPPQTSVIQRVDENVTEVRVTGDSAPIGAADVAGKIECGSWRRAGREVCPRCVRAAIDDATAFFYQVATGRRVSFRRIGGCDQVVRF